MKREDDNRALGQAQAQFESIEELMTAYGLDWGRLDELRAEKYDCERRNEVMDDEALEELADLERDAAGYEDQDAVQQAISEDPLSVEARSGWHSPGEVTADEEFQILLCTGGPAVRIVGELNGYGEPDRAWIEYQDWFTSWQRWHGGSEDVLIEYARRFFF